MKQPNPMDGMSPEERRALKVRLATLTRKELGDNLVVFFNGTDVVIEDEQDNSVSMSPAVMAQFMVWFEQ